MIYNDTETYTLAQLDQFADDGEDITIEYRDGSSGDELFTYAEIVNPSNSEYLLYARIPESMGKTLAIVKEFTMTHDECDWTSTITQAIEHVASKISDDDEDVDYDDMLVEVLEHYPSLQVGASALTITEDGLVIDQWLLNTYLY